MKVRDISLPNIIKVRMDFYKGYEKEHTNTAAGEEKAYIEETELYGGFKTGFILRPIVKR
ncbi:hypothetical protein D6853_07990 [Butyrivibrio sp. X503]|uniref:hypothetical protein n=1 Tax=Butyrivibrio sp. X503 TaxID=2364878 RepID=UPI000EA8F139|nr:hypothetical protein [Butyrivibrio sp. X503]RKM55495.1 hypothetical protein D6853_07990 [Butyrivibrio sp. X503]